MTWYAAEAAPVPLAPVVAASLVALAVAVWPSRGAARRAVVATLFRASRTTRGAARPRRRSPVAIARAGVVALGRRLPGRDQGRDQGGGLDDEMLVTLIDALAPALEAGLGPGRAWELALSRTGIRTFGAGAGLADAVTSAAAAGSPVGEAIAAQARTAGSAPLSLLGIAWQLSEETGAPLAATSRTVARMLRADRAASRRLDAVATESRTTARILTALPLSGPLCMTALGLDPRRLATGGPWLWLALAAGVGLALVGRLWLRRMADRVVRGPALA